VACGRRNVPATLAVARFQCAATGHGAVDCTPAGVAVAASGISIGRRSVAILLAAGAVGLSRKLPAAVAGEVDLEAIKKTIERDFVEGQYYVTGKLTRSAFKDDCIFIDPTTTVAGVERYTSAVAALFDPAASRADLISLEVEDPHTLVLRWRLEGVLRVGGLAIKPYTGTTRYFINDDGLIYQHFETWDISALDAFASCFFPSFGAPPAPPIEQLREGA